MAFFLAFVVLFSVLVGFIAAVYLRILAYSPVLNWWFRFGARYENRWFYDPVWGCVKCIAGQLALWFYLLIVIFPITGHWQARGAIIGKVMAVSTVGSVAYLIFGLIASVSGAIVAAMTINRVIINIEKV